MASLEQNVRQNCWNRIKRDFGGRKCQVAIVGRINEGFLRSQQRELHWSNEWRLLGIKYMISFFFLAGGWGRKWKIFLLERKGNWFYWNEMGNDFVRTKWEIILFERNEKWFCSNEMRNPFVWTKWEIILLEQNGKLFCLKEMGYDILEIVSL